MRRLISVFMIVIMIVSCVLSSSGETTESRKGSIFIPEVIIAEYNKSIEPVFKTLTGESDVSSIRDSIELFFRNTTQDSIVYANKDDSVFVFFACTDRTAVSSNMMIYCSLKENNPLKNLPEIVWAYAVSQLEVNCSFLKFGGWANDAVDGSTYVHESFDAYYKLVDYEHSQILMINNRIGSETAADMSSEKNRTEPVTTPAPAFKASTADDSLYGINAGDIIKMGRYEQDNNGGNGEEPIEWMVLKRSGNSYLLVSVYGLDAVAYGTPMDVGEYSDDSISWETCELRDWLNSEFYETAFSADERKYILSSALVTNDAFGETKTDDYVFCLSIGEVEKLFKDARAMACKPTAYAKSKLKINQGAVSSDGYGNWWLRNMTSVARAASAGNFMDNTYNEAAYIPSKNGIKLAKEGKGCPIFCDYLNVVRPAVWINADAFAHGNAVRNTSKQTPKPTAKPTPTPTPKPLSLSTTKKTIVVGKKLTLKVNNLGSQKVKWSSSNKTVATVSKKGVVKAIEPGKAVITAKIGKKKLKATITVKTNMSLSFKKKTIYIGNTATIKVKKLGKNTVKWTSSKPGVATVSSQGLIRAVSAGKTVITATIGKVTLKAKITVKKKPKPSTNKSNGYMSDRELIEMAKGYFVLCGGIYENVTGSSISHSGGYSYVYLAYGYAHCYVIKLNRKTGVGLGIKKLF